MIVAIDGPAGSGKSTVARALAERIGAHYLDTGAMYRAVALGALRRSIPLTDSAELAALATAAAIEFDHRDGSALPTAVYLDGVDVTAEIRAPDVDAVVSQVASDPGVRRALVTQQREHASRAVLTVAEGRDLGTVVFPGADVKIFLTASSEERSRRRYEQMLARGHSVAREVVRDAILSRDAIDSTRVASPLSIAPDAIEIDTSDLSVSEVVERIAGIVAQLAAAQEGKST